ncbi:MAG TPA: hypothetical protein VKT29_04530 [Terriglobales bacterium]|nr:hypothetical protein [Terriglobales bacterium]
MERFKITGGLVLTLTLLLCSAAMAGNKPASMDLAVAAQVNGKQLPAGTYQLKWEGNGPAVEVQVLKGKQVVATAPAKLETIPVKTSQNATVVDTDNGARNLVEARFAGKNYKLVFTGAAAQAQNTQANGSSAQTNR